MANDKKFIVKNGLLTQETVVIGSTTDNGVNKLQVTGSSFFTQSSSTTPTINITNTGGASNSIIAQFTGDSDNLQILNIGTGDYAIVNSQQNNGIRFYDDTAGIEILYNGSVDIDFNSSGIDFKREPTYNGAVFWNANNDGSGSGLDADLLDGLDSLQFLRSDQDDTFDGNLIITGDLTVQGTTTTINTETILLADNIITLNSNYTGSTPTENAGIEVERGTLTNSSLVWDESNDWWKLISAGTDLGRIITTADEGSGNGFDADTVDGLQAEQFLRSDVDDTAAGNIIIQGILTVGNNTAAGATITMDGQAGNRYIYSNNNEIGFLNSAFAYAAYSDGSNNWRVLNDTYAKRFIDSDNNTYLLDPASTSVLNTIDLEGQIRHNGDTDTFINFNAADSFEVRTGGSQRLLVNNTAVTAVNQMRSPIYYDNDDITYYGDFSATSRLNDISLVGQIIHDGDTDTYLDFNAADSFQIVTGGSARLTVTNTAITGSVDFVGPRFVDSANSNKFVDPAGTSEFNSANFYSAAANNAVNIGISATERFNIDVTDGQGFIRYIQDETDNTDHSVNFQIISTSTGLNRFNFNKNIDVGSNSVSGAFGVFTSGVYAPIFYDNDNELFYADFNNTGVSINAAGTVRAGDGSLAAPTYTFGSDTNTGMYRFAADTIGFSTGGNDEFRIYTTYAQAVGQMRAPIYYDSNNTAYYGDFASTSVMNTIGIDSDIFHNGDTDTRIGFGTDTFTVTTANVARLTVNTTALTSTLNTFAPRFYTNDYLVHTGDENTYIGFNAADTFGVWTNGANRLSITSTEATFSVPTYATTFYTNDYLIHNGDTDTYLGFDANDNFGIWTAGTQRVDINASGNVGIGTVAQDERLEVAGKVQANEYYGPTDKAYSLIPDGISYLKNVYVTETAGAASGYVQIGEELTNGLTDGPYVYLYKDSSGHTINLQTDNNSWIDGLNFGIGTTTPGAKLSVRASTALGNNPFLAANKLIELGDSNSVDFSIRGDGLRNTWAVLESAAQFVFADSGAAILLSMDASTGDVVVGDQQAQYATSDATPTFISAIDANKFHVNGSVQLNGINNALSIYAADAANTAINEATFLAVNELGFSAGGGFYMDEITTVKVRGNKALSTTGNITAGNMYAARFYDSDDITYYGDFATTSRMNDISLVGQIIHDGDTNTYLDFNAADSFQVVTGGSARLTVNNTSVTAAQSFDAPIFRDSGNTSYTLNGNTSSAWRLSTPTGYLDFGSMNASYVHFQTDRAKFYFQKTVSFDGDGIEAYDAAATASFPIYYDWDDTFYYGNFAGFSRMNGITFGNPGNGANTKGRWLSIEGNTDASGEGSSRIFFSEHNSTTASMDAYGMSLVYIGGSTTITSASGQPVTISGISNGEWGLIGHDNSISGSWAMRGPRSAAFVQASGSFRAPIFYDSNNTAFYGDFAGTSITNIMRANQFQVDGSTYVIDSPAGNYGSIRVEGAADGTWAGYAIRDDWVFAADGATNAGIYNDTDNEWAARFYRNAEVELYFNGVLQAETQNGYFLANNQMRAPIYYAPNSTSYWLDLDVGNTSDALRIPGRINRQGFASGNGASNIFLTAQDANHFIWNTATNWGIFWATATDAAYRYAPFGDNMITFVGAGNTRAAIDLDNGNAYFQGEVIAANFNINGGNENLGLLKTYGSGLGDTMLFDATEYWEKRVIQPMQGVENNATTVTAEYAKNNDGPFASTYVLRTNQYRTFDSDYIPVEPGEEIYGEIAARYVSGTGGLLYMGVRRYDKDKNPIASNDGITYFVASAVNVTSTGWTTYRGHTTIPTTHTPFNGSDGGGCKYVRVIVLMNYQAAGALREFGPPVLKRANHLSNIVTQNIDAEGDVYANRYYDRQNTAFYVDPASISIMNDVRASIYYDRDNTARFMNPATGGNVQGSWQWNNGSIIGLNDLQFADPGPNEGIHWAGGNNWRIYESPDNLTTNSAGNLQILYNNNQLALRLNTSGDGTFGRDVYANRYYDRNNAGFYGDFASTSIFNQAIFTNSTPLRFNTTSTAVFDHYTDSTPVAFDMRKGGNTLVDAQSYGVLSLSRTNHNNSSPSAGAGLYFQLKDSAGTLREYAGIYGRKTVAGIGGGELVFMNYGRGEQAFLNSSFFRHVTDIRAPRFTDSDNTAFFVDPASTSVTNVMRANQFQVDGSTYIIDSPSGQYGSIRVDGALGGYAGYAIRDDWVFMSSGAGLAGIYNDTNNQWAAIFRQAAETELFFAGNIQAETQNGFFLANNQMRAPIYYDSQNTAFYVDPNNTSIILNLTVNGTLVVGGFTQNNPVSGQWYQTSTYVYDAVNGTRYYWIRVGQTNNNGAKGILEYYAKDDVNYSENVIGRVVISSWNAASISVDHHTTGPSNGVIPQVRIDNSNYLWLRMEGNAWDSWLRWHWIRADGITLEDGSTKIDTLSSAFPPNSSPTILAGQQTRATMGSVTTATITNTRNEVGGLYSRGAVYGSIFYDTDNNGFYGDFASTSRMNTITINASNHVSGGIAQFYTASGNIRGYIQATETNDAHLIIATSGGEDISFRDGGLAGDWNMIIRGDGNVLVSNFIDATQFRDRNNTAYYMDPASTSVTFNIDNRGEINNDGWFRSDTSGRGLRNTVTNMQWYSDTTSRWRLESTTTTSQILFATSGNSTRGYVYADNGNSIGFLNNSGSWRLQIVNGDWTNIAGSSIRAPIFFDNQDTAYYLDPNSGGRILNLGVGLSASNGGKLSVSGGHGDSDIRLTAIGSTLGSGVTSSMHWWVSEPGVTWNDGGFGYNVDNNGGTPSGFGRVNTSFGQGYMRYTTSGNIIVYNTNTSGTRFQNMEFLSNGTVLANNYLTGGNSLRAPIFYDSNNTAYYFDGATINGSRFEGVNSRTMAMMGLSGQTRSSKEFYAARPRITGDTNYWTGSMGWGTIDMNTVADWGSGFIDSWSNPANQPAGTSHWVGIQALHYTNGSARYGWQMVGGPIPNLRFRNTWVGFNGWRTIPVLDVNNNNTGAMYAGIYYDANNTQFYTDPSGFTNLNTGMRATDIYARSWLRNDSANAGLYNQATAAHWYSTSSQYWIAAGGNNAADMNIRGLAGYQGTSRFWLHGATDGRQGFLNSNGSWLFRMSHNAGLSPGIWFYEAGETWTGNPGSDVGKIEYHANRMYIVSGSNSDRIVQFRRDGTDRSWIANDGVFVGTATSARYADLAERYEADAIYEAGTVLGIGGDKEVTLYQPGMPLAGAVSTKPAYRMNDENYGNDNSIESKMNPFVALKGRIPVKINGSAKKGQWIVADKDGKGRAVDYGSDVNKHEIIGIAIGDGEGVVEVKV